MDCDYIVVGAGSSGCVLANRLTESPKNRVLLLEAGPEDKNFWIHIPLGFGKNINNPEVNWCYEGQAEPYCRGQRYLLPRGKVLGGSSSINGMVYVRGQAEDFDHWAQLGNRGWSFDDVLPYFIKSEDNTRGANHLRGVGGLLTVSDISETNELCDRLIDAGAELGLERNDDINGEVQEGIGYHQATIRNGRRCSTAAAFLKPARNRQNLKIETGAHVKRIIFQEKKAIGVEYEKNGVSHRAFADCEIILSGGAFNSPQLLELSGVGQPEVIKKSGIEVVHELPGVGDQLQDHQIIRMRWRIARNVTFNEQVHGWRAVRSAVKYLFKRSGVLSMPTLPISAFAKTRPELMSPDLQIQVFPGSYENLEARKLDSQPGVTLGATMLRPESRGWVHILSPDPFEPPAIFHNLLQTEGDRKTAVLSMKLCRQLMEADAMSNLYGSELTPGKDIKEDDELLEAARDLVQSNWHPTSTCRMGTDKFSVVDDRLRIYGLKNIRVADASIMPTAVSGNTNATCIMIGEKASDMILEDQKKSSL